MSEDIDKAIDEYILDSQIMLEVPEEFVIEIFKAGAKWQRLQILPNPKPSDVRH